MIRLRAPRRLAGLVLTHLHTGHTARMDINMNAVYMKQLALYGTRGMPAWKYPTLLDLITRGVVGDFRAPDVLRFGLTPLYTSFADVEAAVRAIAAVMDEGAWDAPEYRERAAVT